MSCPCNNNNHFHEHVGVPHTCNHVNHMFDPNPPAFYGTWNHLYGHNIANRVSMCQPGVSTGLYRENGPLKCGCCQNTNMLTNVKTKAKITLIMSFEYVNPNANHSIEITPGVVYTIQYLDNGTLNTCTGLVSNIYKVNQLDETYAIYKLRIDCSANYSNNVVVIKSDQIRSIKVFIPYQDEDNSLTNATHRFGTTIGRVITDAVIVDAQLDKNRNIVKGTIISGTLDDGRTVDGLVTGINSSNHIITLKNAQTAGGEITTGDLVSAVFRSGDIDGVEEEDTGFVRNAVIKGIVTDAIISNTIVTGCYTVNSDSASVMDTTLYNSVIIDATVSGEDMISTGGITVGNITTGGISTGGVAIGGTASGYIDGVYYNMVDGSTVISNSNSSSSSNTSSNSNKSSTSNHIGGYYDQNNRFTNTPITRNISNGVDTSFGGIRYNNNGDRPNSSNTNSSSSTSVINNNYNGYNTTSNINSQTRYFDTGNNYTTGKLVTQGGTLIGGKIVGGIKVGNTIYGATIKGGVRTGGITTGGTTSGGTLIPGATSQLSESSMIKGIQWNPDFDKAMSDKEKDRFIGYKYKNTDALILMTDKATQTQTYTNLGSTGLERLQSLPEEPSNHNILKNS